MSVTAYIALGSNLGDREANLRQGLARLAKHEGIRVVRASSFHETDAVGGPPGQGRYLNAAAELETTMAAPDLLRTLLDVHYLDFPRPRGQLVHALGDENQGIPVLILADKREIADDELTPKQAKGKRFFADERSIRRYLSTQHNLPEAG